jgi:hypothetical protein
MKIKYFKRFSKMTAQNDGPHINSETPVDDDRRKFLAACGKFAIVTPPALTVLLSTSLTSEAIAKSGSGGSSGGSGSGGNGGQGGDLWSWLEKLLNQIF